MTNERESIPSETGSAGPGFAVAPGALLAGRYEILDYLGRGGMGIVYKARDRMLDETVAIKVLRPQSFDDPLLAARFLAEIKLARRVTHRNVCRIHDLGQAGPVRFISMQFVDGVELKQLIAQRGGLDPAEAYDIALQLVDGLEAIHAQGIVHRDCKTANVMVDRGGTALLMDFGIAKLRDTDDSGGLTSSGQVVGTPEYMSPEQAQGEETDARSDIYSVGVVLFELFAGTTPFHGDSFLAILDRKRAPLHLDAAMTAKLPAALRPVVMKALETHPSARFASAQELKSALAAARAQAQIEPADTTTSLSLRVQALRTAPGTGDGGGAANVAQPVATLLPRVLLAAGLMGMVLAFLIAQPLSGPRPAPDDPQRASLETSGGGAKPTAIGGQVSEVPQTTTSVDAVAAEFSRSVTACERRDASACMALASAAESAKEYARASELYRVACDAGSAAACTSLGVLYNRALGVAGDAAQAAVFYERGCSAGDMAGCNNLGTLYEFGSVGFRDLAKAQQLYERACGGGVMDACANLGLSLSQSAGASLADRRRARDLLVRACTAGIARACDRE
jgi:TPR repeat protein/tRNA A-37 threonylcarbamoyl transferase component Bud32